MELLLIGAAVLIVSYLIINGRRNSDPLNRKCAAEICELLVSDSKVTPETIAGVFMRNARYQKHANHIVSMVPALLDKAGCPREFAFSVVPLLRQAAAMIPR
jgi:hypothetical protein